MNRIKDLREDLDLKQTELAEKIGITQKALSNYETGRSEPSFDIIFKLSEFFDVSIDYLLCKTNNPSNDNFTEGMEEEDINELKHYRELLKIKRKIENNPKIHTYENTK